jgi:hypothetical protein
VSEQNNPIVIGAQAAWVRLQSHERRSWTDWLAVGRGVEIGAASALLAAGTNQRIGSKYNRAVGAWLREAGFDSMNPQTRYRVLLVLENLPEITAWRDGLDAKRKARFNHPGAVWHEWKRSTREPKPDVEREPLRLRGKPNADQLKKIAAALRELNSRRSVRDYVLDAAPAWNAINDMTTTPASPKMKAAPDGAGTAGRTGAGACVRVSGCSQDTRHVEHSVDKTGRTGKRPHGLAADQPGGCPLQHTETPATPRATLSDCVRVPNVRV